MTLNPTDFHLLPLAIGLWPLGKSKAKSSTTINYGVPIHDSFPDHQITGSRAITRF